MYRNETRYHSMILYYYYTRSRIKCNQKRLVDVWVSPCLTDYVSTSENLNRKSLELPTIHCINCTFIQPLLLDQEENSFNTYLTGALCQMAHLAVICKIITMIV